MDEDTRTAGGSPLPAATGSLAGHAGYLLRSAFVRSTGVAAAVLPNGHQPRDLAILRVLQANGPCSQQELGEVLGINRTIMVKQIDRLESAGYVERQRNTADRRSYALALAPAGREVLDALQPAVDRGEDQLAAALTREERDRLNLLLRMLLPDVDEALPRELAACNGLLLARAHHRLRDRGNSALDALGLNMRDFGILSMLDDSDTGITQRRLAEMADVSGPVLVQPVNALESAGLIERLRNPEDRREYAIRLTDAGLRTLDEARHALEATQERVTELLGAAGDRELQEILRKMLTGPAGDGGEVSEVSESGGIGESGDGSPDAGAATDAGTAAPAGAADSRP